MTWLSIRKWLYGLMAAVIGGTANSVALVIVDPSAAQDWDKLEKFAVTSALISLVLYLKQSPLPPDD